MRSLLFRIFYKIQLKLIKVFSKINTFLWIKIHEFGKEKDKQNSSLTRTSRIYKNLSNKNIAYYKIDKDLPLIYANVIKNPYSEMDTWHEWINDSHFLVSEFKTFEELEKEMPWLKFINKGPAY